MSTALPQRLTAIERLWQRIQSSWQTVLVLVNRDTSSSNLSVIVSEGIGLLQLLAVPVSIILEISRRYGNPVPQTALNEALFVLSVVNPDAVRTVFGYTVFLVLLSIALL